MSKIVSYDLVNDFVATYFQSVMTKAAYIQFLAYFDPIISCMISQGLRCIQHDKLKAFAIKYKDAHASHISVASVQQYADEHFLKKTSTLTYAQIAAILEFIMAEVLETLDQKITDQSIVEKIKKHSDLQMIKRKFSNKKSSSKSSSVKTLVKRPSPRKSPKRKK